MRADNADQRLTRKGHELGCVGQLRYQHFLDKEKKIKEAYNLLNSLQKTASEWGKLGIPISIDSGRKNATELLQRGNISTETLKQMFPAVAQLESEVLENIEAECSYSAIMDRVNKEIRSLKKDKDVKIPLDLDYSNLPFLSSEEREKLSRAKPENLAHASRIPGITPSSLVLLLHYAKKGKFVSNSSN